MQEQMEHYADIEETLNKSIVVAQETSEELKANARKEAQLIKKEAEKNADRIVNDALSESRKIAYETEEMKRQSNVFRTRLKMLIEAQLDMVNNDDWRSEERRVGKECRYGWWRDGGKKREREEEVGD